MRSQLITNLERFFFFFLFLLLYLKIGSKGVEVWWKDIPDGSIVALIFAKFQFSRKRKSIFNHRFHRVLINLKYFFRACCVRFAEWLQRRKRGGMGEREKKRRNEVGAKSTTRLPPSTDP